MSLRYVPNVEPTSRMHRTPPCAGSMTAWLCETSQSCSLPKPTRSDQGHRAQQLPFSLAAACRETERQRAATYTHTHTHTHTHTTEAHICMHAVRAAKDAQGDAALARAADEAAFRRHRKHARRVRARGRQEHATCQQQWQSRTKKGKALHGERRKVRRQEVCGGASKFGRAMVWLPPLRPISMLTASCAALPPLMVGGCVRDGLGRQPASGTHSLLQLHPRTPTLCVTPGPMYTSESRRLTPRNSFLVVVPALARARLLLDAPPRAPFVSARQAQAVAAAHAPSLALSPWMQSRERTQRRAWMHV